MISKRFGRDSGFPDTFVTNTCTHGPRVDFSRSIPPEKDPFNLYGLQQFRELIQNSTRSQTGKMAAVDESFSTLVRNIQSITLRRRRDWPDRDTWQKRARPLAPDFRKNQCDAAPSSPWRHAPERSVAPRTLPNAATLAHRQWIRRNLHRLTNACRVNRSGEKYLLLNPIDSTVVYPLQINYLQLRFIHKTKMRTYIYPDFLY